MNKIDYQVELWTTRQKLENNGVFQPVEEMVKKGLIIKNPEDKKSKYSNLLLGRTQDEDFLKALKKLLYIINVKNK